MNNQYTPIQEAAYKRFQLYWLAQHGFSISDVFGFVTDRISSAMCEGEDLGEVYLEHEFEETGFQGMIYPCINEFLNCEYHNLLLMHQILSESEFDDYKKDRNLKSTDLRSLLPSIAVKTPHGTIFAIDKADPEYPGIELSFAAGEEEDWDLRYPGCIMEYDPTYRGGPNVTEFRDAVPKVVMWVFSKEDPFNEPEACIEME